MTYRCKYYLGKHVSKKLRLSDPSKPRPLLGNQDTAPPRPKKDFNQY